MNSRREVSNEMYTDKDLTFRIKTLVEHANLRGTRAAVIVRLPPNGWLEHFARGHSSVYLDSESTTDRADRISAMLGSEQTMVVVQLGSRPDLGLLAAIAGTIRAGGLLVVGTATGADVATDSKELSDALTDTSGSSRSTRRLEKIARQTAARYPDVFLSVGAITDSTDHLSRSSNPLPLKSPLFPPDEISPGRNPAAANEQDAMLVRACKHLGTATRCCIVIKGRRGRGKSTLLARIAHHLHSQKEDFYITALHDSAMSVFRQHAPPTARYISPEAAASNPPDTLLIEEAASFPLPLLQIYLDRCRRAVLCTTTEGYETSGRALDVRLFSDWACADMPLLPLDVKHPWRWASEDPLEQFIDQLLLNQTSGFSVVSELGSWPDPARQARQCRVTLLSVDELHTNEKQLAAVQALLLSTHYQSSPKDLGHLLDAPTIELWVQLQGDSVAAILLLEHEGAIEDSLHEAIVSKSRRLRHQLLPQLLAQTANNSRALGKRYVRVIRLAVAPALRRQGLASGLLHAVISRHAKHVAADVPNSHALDEPIALPTHTMNATDAIGASFATDPSSLAFWKTQGFVEFHRGFRANPRTGKRAVAVLQCVDPVVGSVLQQAARINDDNESARRSGSDTWQLPPPTVEEPTASESIGLDKSLLIRFAAGERSKHDTFAALQRLSEKIPLPMQHQQGQSQRLHELELRRCVQQWISSNRRN